LQRPSALGGLGKDRDLYLDSQPRWGKTGPGGKEERHVRPRRYPVEGLGGEQVAHKSWVLNTFRRVKKAQLPVVGEADTSGKAVGKGGKQPATIFWVNGLGFAANTLGGNAGVQHWWSFEECIKGGGSDGCSAPGSKISKRGSITRGRAVELKGLGEAVYF